MTAGGNRGFDARVAHPARVYDYWLGGKDNISQVLPAVPYSDRTESVQERRQHYSKTECSAVRSLSTPCLVAYVRFVGQGFLTLS
jgi:hypothetical protein